MKEGIFIGCLITLLGIVVSLGWIMDIGFVRNIHSDFVTMKISTSLAFFFAGVAIIFNSIERRLRKIYAEAIRTLACIGILICMVPVIVEYFFGGVAAVERLYAHKDLPTETVRPGRPSVGTMLLFFLFSVGILLPKGETSYIAGLIMGFCSVLALLGYLYSIPFLYWYIPSYSTAMALHTSLGFLLCSFGITLSAWDGVKWQSWQHQVTLRV